MRNWQTESNNWKMKLLNPEVRIETTNLCNANCVMCNHGRILRPHGVMSNEFFGSLVRQAHFLGAELISPFGFGEPFMDKELETKVLVAHLMGLNTFITTNGSLATPERMIKLYENGLSHIRFSIHGLNRVDFENVQHGLKWMPSLLNIYRAIQIRDENKYPTEISVTVIPMNGEPVELIRKFWEGIVDWLEIWKPHNWSCVMDYRQNTENRRKTCGRPHKGPVQIQWDGRVIPCCFLTDAELVLGDTHEKTIEQILKDKPYQQLREKHESGDLTGLPCQFCDQLNIEDGSPLLYSNRDEDMNINCTSSAKYQLM